MISLGRWTLSRTDCGACNSHVAAAATDQRLAERAEPLNEGVQTATKNNSEWQDKLVAKPSASGAASHTRASNDEHWCSTCGLTGVQA